MAELQLDTASGALHGKVAVVTGAGRGLGREIALTLARLGADVVVAEIIEESGVETAREIRTLGRRALFVPTDIGEESSIYKLAVETIKSFGTVDILVNNAALAPVASIEETDTALWERVMAVNLRGPFQLFKSLRSCLRQGDGGTVVNILCGLAMNAPGIAHMSAYGVSKAGLASLTAAMAQEVEREGIRVCGLAVGMTDTPGGRKAFRELARRTGLDYEGFPARLKPPGVVAAAVVYLVIRAGEYHGTIVEDRELIAELGRADQPTAPKPVPGEPVTVPEGIEETFRDLVGVIDLLEEGYQRLPLFIRPIAAGALRKQTGLTLSQWRAWTAELFTAAQGMVRARPEERAGYVQVLLARDDRDKALAGLAGYVQGIPEQVKRYTKDPAVLDELTRIAVEQEKRIQRARRVLQTLAGAV